MGRARRKEASPAFAVSFAVTKQERLEIDAIVARYAALVASQVILSKDEILSLTMDLCATHANGCPMDFDRLLKADDFNLMHDVGGIYRKIDRETGKLTDFFHPRFATKVPR